MYNQRSAQFIGGTLISSIAGIIGLLGAFVSIFSWDPPVQIFIGIVVTITIGVILVIVRTARRGSYKL